LRAVFGGDPTYGSTTHEDDMGRKTFFGMIPRLARDVEAQIEWDDAEVW
jgi:hypothetical protein